MDSENLLIILRPVFKSEDDLKSFLITCYHNQKIKTNVEEVSGLHIIYDAFNEETEKRFFNQPNLWPPFEMIGGHNRSGRSCSLYMYPVEIFQIFNIIQDSGFIKPEHFVIPNYCLCLSYPMGSVFSPHFDSRFRWGIYIIGVNLGAPCVLSMNHPKDSTKNRKILLPRRSIYVMSGDSRYDYKHSIAKINNVSGCELANPEWNPTGIRRSFTLRSTKVHETVVLEKKLKEDGPSAILSSMTLENKKFEPRGDYGETKSLSAEEVKREREFSEYQLNVITTEDLKCRI